MMNTHPVEAIIGPVSSFLEKLLTSVSQRGIDVSGKEIDHVCFRCKTIAEYQDVCKRIVVENLGEVLIESMIGGRPITTIKLFSPLVYQDYQILCLEITCPKPGKIHSAGLEHCEIVIGEPGQSPLNSRPLLDSFMAQYPNLRDNFDTKAADKLVNADVCLAVSGGYNVKFHLRPLYEVIAFEMSQGLVEPVPDGFFQQQ